MSPAAIGTSTSCSSTRSTPAFDTPANSGSPSTRPRVASWTLSWRVIDGPMSATPTTIAMSMATPDTPRTAAVPNAATRTGTMNEPAASAPVSVVIISPTARPRTASVVTRCRSVAPVTSSTRWPADTRAIAAIATTSSVARPRITQPTAITRGAEQHRPAEAAPEDEGAGHDRAGHAPDPDRGVEIAGRRLAGRQDVRRDDHGQHADPADDRVVDGAQRDQPGDRPLGSSARPPGSDRPHLQGPHARPPLHPPSLPLRSRTAAVPTGSRR